MIAVALGLNLGIAGQEKGVNNITLERELEPQINRIYADFQDVMPISGLTRQVSEGIDITLLLSAAICVHLWFYFPI